MTDDYPTFTGYEWMIECPCGNTMAGDGMGRRLFNRRSDAIPRTDGDSITCDDCGVEWRLSFSERDTDD